MISGFHSLCHRLLNLVLTGTLIWEVALAVDMVQGTLLVLWVIRFCMLTTGTITTIVWYLCDADLGNGQAGKIPTTKEWGSFICSVITCITCIIPCSLPSPAYPSIVVSLGLPSLE